MTLHDNTYFMQRALTLARKGRPSPNPMVGAVIVNNGVIVGEGFHPKAGEPHAEIFALKAAGEKACGGSLYVNLEPCCHFGRTPPCTNAIINAGIKSVYVAAVDPNPLVSGKGIEQLRNAGIQVDVGLLEDKAHELNKGFIKRIQTGMPYITWKAAMSIDGKIATKSGDSRWITGERARREVQKLRNANDAIITGIGTVIADDPEMTVHGIKNAQNPVRVILDSKASIPLEAQILSGDAQTIIFITSNAPADKICHLKSKCEVIVVPSDPDGRVDLKSVMIKLGEIGINTALLECGGELAASMLNAHLIDEGIVFIAPKIIGGREAKTIVEGSGIDRISDAISTSLITTRRFDPDVALKFKIIH